MTRITPGNIVIVLQFGFEHLQVDWRKQIKAFKQLNTPSTSSPTLSCWTSTVTTLSVEFFPAGAFHLLLKKWVQKIQHGILFCFWNSQSKGWKQLMEDEQSKNPSCLPILLTPFSGHRYYPITITMIFDDNQLSHSNIETTLKAVGSIPGASVNCMLENIDSERAKYNRPSTTSSLPPGVHSVHTRCASQICYCPNSDQTTAS